MNFFTQKRYLIFIIIVLVILNLGTLVTLWLGRPHPAPGRFGSARPEPGQIHLQKLLKQELGFDEEQTQQYLQLRRQHREQIRNLEQQIRQIKRQMFDEVLKENPQPTLSDSLLKLMQDKQAEIEHVTFQHLLNLKKICTPEQQKKLKLLIHAILPPPNVPPGDARPAHPPKGERPPRRPPKN